METIWLIFTTVLSFVFAAVMWATSVSPDQVASNASKWAQWFGVSNPPEWLKDKAADKRIRKYAFAALLASVFSAGALTHAIWVSAAPSLLASVGFMGPQRGQETAQLVNVIDGRFSRAEGDNPVLGTLSYTPNVDGGLKRQCVKGRIFGAAERVDDAEHTRRLAILAKMTEVEFSGDEISNCGTLGYPGKFSSFYPHGTWGKSSVDDILSGEMYAYIYAIFIYRKTDDSPVIVQTECKYFFRSTTTMHACSGDTHRAYYAGNI